MHSSSSYYYSSLPLLPPSSCSRSSIHASNSGSRKCNQLPLPVAVTPLAMIVPRLSSSFTRSSSSSNSSISFFSVVQEPKPNGYSGRTCNLLTHRCQCHHRRHQDSSVSSSSSSEKEEEEDEEYQVVTAMRSNYNHIVIVDTPKARMLLLDSTHNVHSMLRKRGQKWTGSYWDEFASLPAIIPKGPVAILGLGGGTAAHLMLDSWPSLQIEGWEIDEILIDKARDYFGLSDLESHNEAGGILHVHIGDALCPTKTNAGRYAGIVIDLFSEGKVLANLQKISTWLELKDRLIPNGRFIVNCGGIKEETDGTDASVYSKSVDGMWAKNSTIKVLCKAFPGQLFMDQHSVTGFGGYCSACLSSRGHRVSWNRMPESHGANYLALTGPLPDLTSWSAAVPKHLRANVWQWKLCDPSG